MQPKVMRVSVGKPIKFVCYSYPQYSVQWSFNSEADEVPNSIQSSDGGGLNYLRIDHVNLDHTGRYTCRYIFKYITFQGEAFLIVKGKLAEKF